MNPAHSAELLSKLKQLDGPALSNAIETLQLRLRNEGFVRGEIKSIFPGLAPMVGYAVPLKVRTDKPPTGASFYLDRTDWWDLVMKTPAPRVLVLQDVGEVVGLGALLGEIHVRVLQYLGCTGAVTNGAVRDLPAIRSLDFPLFAGRVSVSHGYAHIVELGQPVEMGGLTIEPGMLLHGDEHGVQHVPHSSAERLPELAAQLSDHEDAIRAVFRQPGLTTDELRAALISPQS